VLTALNAISSIRVLMPSDIRPPAARTTVSRAVGQVRARFPTGVPTLDPIEDMGISSDLLAKELRRISVLRAELASTAFSSKDVIPVEAREEALAGMRKKNDLAAEIKTVRGEIKTTESVVMLSSLRRMKRVLRQLGYAGSDGVITTKGRFACEVSTADELLTTELVFSGAFNDLTPALTAALASCLVYQEKADENAKLKQELELPFRGLKDTARAIAKVCVECKIELDVEEYVASYKPDLMEVVHRWCQGANFAEIMSLTDIFEGSVVRNCRRLDELLRQLSQAATSIGNTQLAEQFAQASTLLARGVIFSASLYL
jgi:ATP-dependent RNA helicase DOB1